MQKHISQSNDMYRLFYENYMACEKQKYVITIDEAQIYLFVFNKQRSFYNRKKEKKKPLNFGSEERSFTNILCFIAEFSYNEKHKTREVGKKKQNFKGLTIRLIF